MRPKSSTPETPSERLVRDIRRATRKQYSAAEKIRIVLDGLRGEVSIAELCRLAANIVLVCLPATAQNTSLSTSDNKFLHRRLLTIPARATAANSAPARNVPCGPIRSQSAPAITLAARSATPVMRLNIP
jgi:hypothetical protein